MVFTWKLGAPIESEIWCACWVRDVGGEDGEGKRNTIEVVMFDDAEELMAGRMRDYCEHKGIWINSSVPYSPPLNGATKEHLQCGHEQHAHNAAWLKLPIMLLGRGEDNLHVPAQQDADKGEW